MVRKLAITLALAAPLLAQQLPPDQLSFERLPQRVRLPVGLVDPGDGTGRLFAVSQVGRILALIPDEGFPITMLNIEDRVSCCGEQGLLGLALHPDFLDNGLLYVNYTNNVGESGHSILARYKISADDPNRIDPDSEKILLDIEQTTVGHNGGQISFGGDGYLYTTFGDGGLPGEFPDTAQDLGSLLGKILRIDVNTGDPYAIPPTNPFVDTPGARGEIYHSGLRNPWRFSFDRENQDMFIADVGDGEWEEVSFQAGSSRGGANYGWRFFEGSNCWKNSTFCNPEGLTPPILEYRHSEPNGCGYSVTGGYVYRGYEMEPFRGAYIFGDFCTGELWAATESGGRWSMGEPLATGWRISTFAEGSTGELYVANYAASEFYRITMARPSPEVSAVAPSILSAGAVDGAVTVKGERFHPASIVTLDGVDRATEFVDNRTLITRLSADTLATVGTTRLAVRTDGPGGGVSSEIDVEIVAADDPPSFPANGVVNAASFAAGPLAPGTIISIFGDRVALADEISSFLPLPLGLGGASVSFNDTGAAQLFSATDRQLNLLLPLSLSGSDTVRITVRLGSEVAQVSVPLGQYSPGVFTIDSSGTGQGAVTIASSGGCLAGPPVRALCGRPVRAGQALEIYATGLGPLVSRFPAGRLQRPAVTAVLPEVAIGGAAATVLYSGMAPGFEGLYQVNVLVLEGTPTGSQVSLELRIGGIAANPVEIAVQ